MRVLCIDQQGNALDFVLRCQDDGHEVRHFIKDTEKSKWIGKGLVPTTRDWREWIRWADLTVLSDNTLYLRELDAYRKENPKARIIGATQETAAWELDRTEGMKVLNKHGIDTAPFKEFNDYDKAIAHVKKEERAFVSKPSGDADKTLSYVAKSPADMVFMLERWKKAGKLKAPFILQDRIEGCEMAVGGWFGPGGFNEGWHENWEHKKLFDGDIGPTTGEMGTVIRVVRASKLAKKMLAPLAETLECLAYVGYVDVNTIIDEKGNAWPLEFTMRPGWPTFNIQQALHEGDRAQWLMDLAEGKDARNWRMDEIAVGVVMAIPDHPYSHWTRKEVIGVPIYGLSPKLLPHVHPAEIMLGEAPFGIGGKVVMKPCWVSAGDYLLVATGTGATVREARVQAYRVLGRLKATPNSPFWRKDIGCRLKSQLPACQASGYAAGLQY